MKGRTVLLLLLLLTGYCPAIEVLLEEDFSGDLEDRWIQFGDPSPIICDSFGDTPPSFDSNGDSMWDSGIASRAGFALEGTLVLECDLFVPSNERGSWITGEIQLARLTGAALDPCGIETDVRVSMCYSYSGEADWGCPHLQGHLQLCCGSNPDDWEYLSMPHTNGYLDQWHRFRIEIHEDRTSSFFIDDSLIHASAIRLPADVDSLTLILSGRSGTYSRVFHDNVVLMRQY